MGKLIRLVERDGSVRIDVLVRVERVLELVVPLGVQVIAQHEHAGDADRRERHDHQR